MPLPPFKNLSECPFKILKGLSSCPPKIFFQFMLQWDYLRLFLMLMWGKVIIQLGVNMVFERANQMTQNSLSHFSLGLALLMHPLWAQILCYAADTSSTELIASYFTSILAVTWPLLILVWLTHPYLHWMELAWSVQYWSGGGKYIKDWVPQGLELELSQSP